MLPQPQHASVLVVVSVVLMLALVVVGGGVGVGGVFVHNPEILLVCCWSGCALEARYHRFFIRYYFRKKKITSAVRDSLTCSELETRLLGTDCLEVVQGGVLGL